MKKNLFTKALLPLATVLIIVGVLYLSSAYADSTTTPDDGLSSDAISAQIVSKISILNSVSLKDTMFKNAMFTSLVDYSRPLPDQDIGRNNPFAPIGQ